MKKKTKILIAAIVVLAILLVTTILIIANSSKLKTVTSEKQLLSFYNGTYNDSDFDEVIVNILGMPFSFLASDYNNIRYRNIVEDTMYEGIKSIDDTNSISTSDLYTKDSLPTNDYSTTNIQVENVDEADIIKTDGNYIYSISYNNVIITDVSDPTNIKVVSTINSASNIYPEDLILNNDKLIVIFNKPLNSSTYYSSTKNSNTVVKIYNIANKEKPFVEKSYELYEPYYTSRCINNTLYVISSGNLRKENKKIVRDYIEDNMSREIPLNNIKYLDDVTTKKQTLISTVDLNNLSANIKLDSYLIDISNAYVSENAIYLLNANYRYSDVPEISSIFGFKGLFGAFEESENYDYGYYTGIYKFDILNTGNIKFSSNTEVKGKTINQYSLDEQNNHLRLALTDSDGSRIAIFDKDLKEISVSGNIAKGEKMYSSRFIGNKVYMVTYKTMDPLWVIDLSDETNPKVLGELSIPGYSTYLHPYDENHIIGIGMQTEEIVRKTSSGKVISTTSKITGMKMALFDISDVRNPIQISDTIIGDSKTTSAILTNPKALLFSKDKNLIAIPVNNYKDDFNVTTTEDTYEAAIKSYQNYSNPYIAEGYYVYNINTDDGFNLKGIINHDIGNYSATTFLLRGLYINDNLYTVSENQIKVNNLDSLDLVTELKLK